MPDVKLVLADEVVSELMCSTPGDPGMGGYKLVECNLHDSGRWSLIYRMVVEDAWGRFWVGYPERAATERVSGDYDDPVTFTQVFPRTKSVVVFE